MIILNLPRLYFTFLFRLNKHLRCLDCRRLAVTWLCEGTSKCVVKHILGTISKQVRRLCASVKFKYYGTVMIDMIMQV